MSSKAPAFSSSSTAPARARMFSTLSSARCIASPRSAISSPPPVAASEIRTCASEAEYCALMSSFFVCTKKEVIKAQYSASEAQVRISEAATGGGEEMADLGLAMQRAEDKVENMRARAGAVDELEKAGAFDDITQLGSGGQDDIDKELAQLSSGAEVEDELSKMKAELGA